MSSRRSVTVARFTTCSDAQIINKEEPILVESPVEDRKDQLLEIFRAISGAEREASRKPTPSGRQHSHLFLGLLLVIDLIEAFLKITHRDKAATRHSTLDVV